MILINLVKQAILIIQQTFKLKTYEKKNKILILLYPFISLPAFSTNFYIDNQATGSNDGSSWLNAWQSFTAIGWNNIDPGDTLFISGGTNEKTYAEPLTIKASGDESGDITIAVGKEDNHHGKVIITGGPYWGVLLDGSGMSTDDSCFYVTISGKVTGSDDCHIKISNPDANGVSMRGLVGHFTIEHIEIAENGSTDAALGENGQAEIHGLTSSLSTELKELKGEIRYCKFHDNDADDIHLAGFNPVTKFGNLKIHHCEFYNYNDDCIETGLSSVDIYNNVFRDRALYRSGHPDNIQAYGSYLRVYNNYFYNMIRDDDNAGNCQLYFHPTPSSAGYQCSHLYAYNNVFYEERTPPENGNGAIQMGFGYGITSLSDVVFVNNTLIGSWGSALSIQFANLTSDSVNNIVIENNIFTDCGRYPFLEGSIGITDGGLTYGPHGSDADIIIDYNTYHGDKADYFYYGTVGRSTYENFKLNTGCQAHEVIIDPWLDEFHKPANDTSPVVNQGVNLSQYFTFDKDGNTRPFDEAWDIGAFEFNTEIKDTSDSDTITDTVTAVAGLYHNQNIKIYPNYPNPFYESTNITFEIPKLMSIKIDLLDLSGRKIIPIYKGMKEKGRHVIKFTGNNLKEGIYLYRLTAGNYSIIKKCVLLR